MTDQSERKICPICKGKGTVPTKCPRCFGSGKEEPEHTLFMLRFRDNVAMMVLDSPRNLGFSVRPNEFDVKHKLSKVTWRDSVREQCLNYFKRFPEHEEWFINELNELYWQNKYSGQYRNHISLTAVPLANKIYEQLGMITFPFIQRVACRGWDTAGGTWAWSMQTKTGDIGSGDPVKYLLKKRVTLYAADGYNSNGEIGGTP